MKQYYYSVLHAIEAQIGRGITTNLQLDKIGRKILPKRFIGCYSSNDLPHMQDKQVAIVNNQTLDKPGEHWMCVIRENGRTYLKDSYDRPPASISPYFKTFIGIGNGKPEQRWNQECCGEMSLAAMTVYKHYGLPGLALI